MSQDRILKLNTLAVLVDGDYMRELEEYEEGKAKYGENYGEKNKPKPLTGSYSPKYYNTSLYKIISFSSFWDKAEDSEVILAEWFNLATKQIENFNIKMTEMEFLTILPYFNAVYMDHNVPILIPNFTISNSTGNPIPNTFTT